jgi:hypothetical protein
MAAIPAQEADVQRADHHANEAERLLKSWWLSSHVKAQVHATLAVYYSAKRSDHRE